MKRVQCIKPKGKLWSLTGSIGPQYGDIVNVIGDSIPTSQGKPTYKLEGYPAYGWVKHYFRELVSDEDLEAYKDKVSKLNLVEVSPVEILQSMLKV